MLTFENLTIPSLSFDAKTGSGLKSKDQKKFTRLMRVFNKRNGFVLKQEQTRKTRRCLHKFVPLWGGYV
jgi:hypothetical protein